MAKQQQFPGLKSGMGLFSKVLVVLVVILVGVAVVKGPVAAADLVKVVVDGVSTFVRSL